MEPEFQTAAIQWLSPEGLAALTAAIGTVLSVIVAVLNFLGKKEAAAKAAELGSVATGLIEGIEKHRRSGNLEDARKLAESIRGVTSAKGIESVVNQLVKTVTQNSTTAAITGQTTSEKSDPEA